MERNSVVHRVRRMLVSISAIAMLAVLGCGDMSDEVNEGVQDGEAKVDEGGGKRPGREGDGLVNAFATGLYAPVEGTISGNGNWLACGNAYFTGKRHLGTDIMRGVGTGVFAVGAGTVLAISQNGWESGNVALAILHESSAGSFVAIYGHIRNLTVGVGRAS